MTQRDRDRRQPLLGADRVEDGEHLVVLHELVRGAHGERHLVLRVLDDELDLAAVDAARRIGGGEADLRGERRRRAADGQRAGQVGVAAELHRRVGDALRFGEKRRGGQ